MSFFDLFKDKKEVKKKSKYVSNEKKFPNEVRCKCCGKMVKAVIGQSPYCRKHKGFVHWECYIGENNCCIDCWNSKD